MTFNKFLCAASVAAGATLGASATSAAQHALVVGINDYASFQPFSQGLPPGQPYDLLGARNDALKIVRALRDAGVSVPQDRVLLDSGATEQAFLDAFERMKASAAPGDTLIITFAGHGAQELERSAPLDEADGRDEIIMFHDFDPARPGSGRLTDDELQTLMRAASDYKILWVMDSCHSGGLVRSTARPTSLSRFGGLFDGLPDPSLSDLPLTADESSSDGSGLPHVTQILATASEVLRVNETEIDGNMHGALSWHFAEAIGGAADANGDASLSRGELAAFLEQRVFERMNQSQQPRVFPENDEADLFTLASRQVAQLTQASPLTPTLDETVTVNFLGSLPPGLDPERIRRVPTGASLTFEWVGEGRWEVFNRTGDRVTTIDTTGSGEGFLNGWPSTAEPLIDRALGIKSLWSVAAPELPPIGIVAEHGTGVLSIGETATFEFIPPNADLSFLTLFNIAGNGEVQPLFPTMGQGNGQVDPDGIELSFLVSAPVGVDRLFVVACPTEPVALRSTLSASMGGTVTRAIADSVIGQGCQIGSAGLYTQN